MLELDDNFFTGTIPEGIAQLTALTRLELGTHSSGLLCFANMESYNFVRDFFHTTDTNRLTGAVPPLPESLKDFKCQLEENGFNNVDNARTINCDF